MFVETLKEIMEDRRGHSLEERGKKEGKGEGGKGERETLTSSEYASNSFSLLSPSYSE